MRKVRFHDGARAPVSGARIAGALHGGICSEGK